MNRRGPHFDRAFRGESVRYELCLPVHPRTGRAHFYDVSCEPRSVDGTVREMVVVLTDITDRKVAENALREADLRKDEFLATLAHELRNPLAPLRSGLELMRRTSPPDPQALTRVQAMMERQLTQMVRLVDDLLDVNRIGRGKLDLRKETIDVATAIDSAVETCRPLVEAESQELVVRQAPEPVLVDADLTRLSQVFANLLNNAVKYTEPGGRIGISAECERGEAVIRVRDSGIGIPNETLPTIFDMFRQGDKSIERAHGGLGIGLTLVRRIVEMHGGSVAAQSPPAPRPNDDAWPAAKGTEFIVRLPRAAAPAEARTTDETAPARRTPATRLRVLIADDNVDAAESLADLLTDMGNEIRVAHDGAEAVKEASAFRPDVLLLDIGMPNLNGYDVARKIREQPWARRALLVAVTGWGQPEDRRRSAEAGFDHHLVKPIEIDAIEKVLAVAQPIS